MKRDTIRNDHELGDAARRAVRHLNAAGSSVAIADSVTGGAVAALIETTPRGAGCFAGGVVTHLGPNDWLVGIDSLDAIDESSAHRMADRTRWMFDADIGVGVVGRYQEGDPRQVYVGWVAPRGEGVVALPVDVASEPAGKAVCLTVLSLVAASAIDSGLREIHTSI